MKLNNKTYDILKWIALVALNAIGVCYKTISIIWGIPYGEEVMGTCAALALCLGALIGVSSVQYHSEKEQEKKTNHIISYSDEEE